MLSWPYPVPILVAPHAASAGGHELSVAVPAEPWASACALRALL